MSSDKQARNRQPRKPRSDFQRLSRRFMSGLLRSLFLINKPTRVGQAGFVLPTTVLLLLMVTLTVGALSFRSFSRTQSVIAQREQEVIVGAATPAVDRAKAKIEYLFAKDIRIPGGLPTSNKIQAMMKNVVNTESGGSANNPLPGTPAGSDDQDVPPYTLPDETRLDLNRDGELDNAWSFPVDIDGNGQIDDSDGDGEPDEIIVYSVIMDDAQAAPAIDGTPAAQTDITKVVDTAKAQALVNRNASIDTAAQGNACPVFTPPDAPGATPNVRDANNPGWEGLDNVTLLKNFQIDVFVINDNPANRTVSTLEFQQVRQATRGNKWGAWFKNDIELFPGDGFFWNGAMHTEGSVFLGNDPTLNMVSAYASCLYPDRRSSEITLATRPETPSLEKFEGQFVMGKIGDGSLRDAGGRPIVDWFINTASHGTTTFLKNGSDDSVTPDSNATDSIDIALNPIEMFTADRSMHRDPDTWSRAGAWDNSSAVLKKRILNQNENTPFLDDLFRADNRYGPKSAYTSNFRLEDVNDGAGVSIGTDMRTGASLGPPELADPQNGLDGYWERQAIREGLRIIGGQRLELGNNTGWRGNLAAPAIPPTPIDNIGMDPLYNEALSFNGTNSAATRKSLRLHRLSLRDNLAAVQSMAVYHADGAGNGTFPMMCMSMASHPGTPRTITRSTSFNNVTSTTDSSSTQLDIDFFNGFGTNGWEYNPPLNNDEAYFQASYDGTGGATGLKKALKNLAYFAGDPRGGAPSFTPIQDRYIHPYPMFSMWGDFSHLRRLVDSGAPDNLAAINYDNLSPADQSYLHTAACTLGMLADNIKTVQDFPLSPDDLTAIASAMSLKNMDTPLFKVPDVGLKTGVYPAVTAPSPLVTPNSFVLPTSPHAYLSTLEATSAVDRNVAKLARILHLKAQIERDQQYGFTAKTYPYPLKFDQNLTAVAFSAPDRQSIEKSLVPGSATSIDLGIDFSAIATGIGGNYFGIGIPDTPEKERKFLQLAAITGGIDIPLDPLRAPYKNAGQPKYPSLFYLFPAADHDHKGAGSTPQPLAEPYIDDHVDSSDADALPDQYVAKRNLIVPYQQLSPTEFDELRLNRKIASATGTNSWTSPYIDIATAGTRPNEIKVDGNTKAILLLDKGFMDGREMLSSRSIDIDIDLATSASEAVDSDTSVSPAIPITWIAPETGSASGGIVYAFREDAKREDSIVRPRRAMPSTEEAAWTACSSNIIGANCLMNFDFDSPFDPPLRRTSDKTDNYISPKPVDYFADPLRRPYGFRLSNGAKLNRPDTIYAGMSFISDNPVFIKGDFNLHQNASGATQEEFTTALGANYNNFYTRTGPAPDFGRNPNYGNPAVDQWRPVEIVGDSVGILSDRWKDGAISDTFTLLRPSSGNYSSASFTDGDRSSYRNHLRLKGTNSGEFLGLGSALGQLNIANASWFRENPYDGNNGGESSPVRVWRDGEFLGGQVQYRNTGSPTIQSLQDNLMTLNTGSLDNIRKRDRIRAQQTAVNALLVTGVVPSRRNQSNGGLHNLPRLLEHWRIGDPEADVINLNIAGGFFQLNYSTSATGPWDQRADYWEPDPRTTSGSPFSITYYGAPGRRWGYDVALQFAPAGPVSTRFITIGSPRSEYYQEVAADDPYMVNLQCAVKGDGSSVIDNPTVTCPATP